MNGLESRWADVLAARQAAGEVVWWRFEAITLKLAADTRYTPDFLVMLPDGHLEAHEIKGHMRDDARVKLRVAASLYPFTFRLVMQARTPHGARLTGWSEEVVEA